MKADTKIAAPFVYGGKYNDVIDQYNIFYTPGINDGMKLIEFLDMYSDKYINIAFPKGVNCEQIKPLRTFENMRVRITQPSEFSSIEELKNNNINFFFDEKFAPISWKQLSDQISLGCCQIYIEDDLTHDIDKVYNVCQSHEVGIRCVLNHVHATGQYKGHNPQDWFIRPEDMDYINKYYDAFEFDCSHVDEDGIEHYEWNKFHALYHVFFETKKYVGDLREINNQLRFNFHNQQFMPQYGSRGFCGGHCFKGSSCNICGNYKRLADLLYDKDVAVIQEKE